MIRAQGTLYVPEGKSLVLDPGITTDLAGTIPLCSTGSRPVTSMMGVLEVKTTPAPIQPLLPTLYSLNYNTPRTYKCSILDNYW